MSKVFIVSLIAAVIILSGVSYYANNYNNISDPSKFPAFDDNLAHC